MKSLVFLSAVALMLSSCTTPDVEPIPGSITYGGQPRTKLTKSPIGSVVHNSFRYRTGVAYETYIIQPDRSLKLIRREIRSDFFDQN
ncbi:hypothetical protein OIU34_12285 [Pararhizobium sp. BT-229]|jgi:hypothetical protein|uniref:hypothetical protein n=1 Tax=Pararhizobium sp. BT-229 TaxID=2986923 RepID=UPI0021F6C9A2|nr:hypothetical protein [Pararhizobium sp. BT-229]MCV9962679.1 hypothetical protein [Pararhizobium sp. BT-229]